MNFGQIPHIFAQTQQKQGVTQILQALGEVLQALGEVIQALGEEIQGLGEEIQGLGEEIRARSQAPAWERTTEKLLLCICPFEAGASLPGIPKRELGNELKLSKPSERSSKGARVKFEI